MRATLVLAASLVVALAVEPQPYDPVADSGAVVESSDKHVRVTVLTPCLLRIEEAVVPGTFEDKPSTAFINRKLPVPTFKHSEENGVLSVTTDCLALTYKVGTTLQDGLAVGSVAGTFLWELGRDGLVSPTNLLGTIRSLDEIETIDLNCTNIAGRKVHDEQLHCAWSPFSRDGWHVINDTDTTLMDPKTDWVTNDTSASSSDLYFFGHGLDYRTAIKDYVTVSGNPPLLPKFAMGVMWSRWYDVSSGDIRYLVDDGYGAHGLPLDLFVIDMDWHAKYSANWSAVGQEWTGWTFDRRLFPYPDDYFAWLRHKGLAASLNIHDASGVPADELRYDDFCKAVGADPSSQTTIPAWFDDEAYMNAVEDVLLQPFQEGSGYRWAAWRDWQQGGTTGVRTRNLQPTIWLNHASVTDPYRRGENWRGWTLARYGGIGNQRYPTGFSGDVQHSQTSLAFQVYFTTTAASVSYQWSNDIVGQSGNDLNEQELHTKWVLWGAFSPLFRTHDAGGAVGPCADKGGCEVIELWNAPKHLVDAHRWALGERQALLPTWYTLNQQASSTGLNPVRPMYLTWPSDTTSYLQIVRNQQYTIGDDIIVSPVTAMADVAEWTTNWTYWLPDGEWYDDITGRLWSTKDMPSSPANLSSAYDVSEVPRAFRAGAVIARMPYDRHDVIAVSIRAYTHLVFDVYPGGQGSGSAAVYEDDGESLNYTRGESATTTMSYTTSTTNADATTATTTATISTQGSYDGLPASRAYSVRLVMAYPPTSVKLNGEDVPYAQFGCDAGSRDPTKITTCWGYDGNTLTTTITAAAQATDGKTSIVVTAPTSTPASSSPLNGLKGAIMRARMAKRIVLDPDVRPGDVKSELYYLQRLSTSGDALSHLAAPGNDPTAFAAEVASLPKLAQDCATQVGSLSGKQANTTRVDRALALVSTSWGGWVMPL